MIKEWIGEYKPQSSEDTLSALRQIMQQVTLAGLSRTDFFENAAFYGGTALRIFHGLDRFSEDMDFSLLRADDGFSFEPYFDAIITEFEAIGMRVSIREKPKKHQSPVESAFLKSQTELRQLVLEEIVKQAGIKPTNRTVTIKLEADRQPPVGFATEEKLLLRPFSFYVKCFDLPSLFAGKMHALLFRKWQNRVKGRDWYDLQFYIRQGVPLNLRHFALRAYDSGDWPAESITKEQLLALLQAKIKSVSYAAIREDVVRFIPDESVIRIWGEKYFTDLAERLKFG
jgi:predicted nucleotidyltransferase component of viral defense system